MERTYESARALVCRAVGPLAARLGAYVAWLASQQYAIDVVYIKTRHALAFDHWLDRRGVALSDLDESHISQYQRRSRRAPITPRLDATPGVARIGSAAELLAPAGRGGIGSCWRHRACQ